ncbi:histidinol-phosphate transaminase [Salirhabdus sp. Marseille-P4669]|uniref:histidinol-phosphate transaminase n=1 Tax=Salirhabdus sp. Marseille-P4669 TaxID=2042310 RepID=UPI000C7DA7AE|nr:histidinol-phosphate transaminase [Salirhabdus sp. Marseille-P4669]
MSKYWSRLVKDTDPYVPGEQPQTKVVKLNTNENPYPPSPNVLKAIKEATNDELRLYPSPTVDELRDTIANYYHLQRDQLFIGNGSDEVLAFSFMAFFNQDEKIRFPDITYSFYPVYAKLFNIKYDLVPVKEDFTIPVDSFFQSEGGVIFPNPNAPTGLALSLEEIKEILKNNSEKVVIIDEAYVDFGCESAVSLLSKFDNLLVIQTLSKSRSLAGLRVGFAMGSADLIEGLNRIKNSFNSYTMDRLALAGAKAAMEDEAYFQLTKNKIISERNETKDKLLQLGFEVLDSSTNFLFIKPRQISAEELYIKLKNKGIYVRYFNKPHINEYIRLTIGNREDMEQFFSALKQIVYN